MPIGAGKRDTKIVFERGTPAQDAYGEDISTWATWCSPLAAVRYGTSAERRQAASEGGSQSATFRVLATAKTRAVGKTDSTDRISFDGAAWDIEGISPIGRTEIEFTAVRAV